MRLKSYFPSPLEVLYFLIIQSKFWKDCVSALLSVPVRGSLFSHGFVSAAYIDKVWCFPSPLEVLYFLMILAQELTEQYVNSTFRPR